jgi:hypothetical protein
LSAQTETYSDSVGVSHNTLQVDTACPSTSYTEYHTNETNSPVKLAYTYVTSGCIQQGSTPTILLSAWDIDPDNANILLGADPSNGSGGTWFTIKTLNSSSMVLTQSYNRSAYVAPADTQIVYHTITDTYTYSTM